MILVLDMDQHGVLVGIYDSVEQAHSDILRKMSSEITSRKSFKEHSEKVGFTDAFNEAISRYNDGIDDYLIIEPSEFKTKFYWPSWNGPIEHSREGFKFNSINYSI